MQLPDELDFVDAAPFFCAGLTMYGGIKNGGYHCRQRVAVLGMGGSGHLGLQIANAMGAEVIAVTATGAKKELAYSLGAHHVINSTGGDVGAQLRRARRCECGVVHDAGHPTHCRARCKGWRLKAPWCSPRSPWRAFLWFLHSCSRFNTGSSAAW